MSNSNKSVIKLLNNNVKIENSKIVKIFTLLTTCPSGSGNVGDKLITESLKALIRDILKKSHIVYFIEYFRGDNLDSRIDIINRTECILLPGFPIRTNMHKSIYKLTKNLKNIKVGFMPIGCGECTNPGYINDIINKKYLRKDKNFINYVLEKSKNGIGCRDPLVMKQLINNNITNISLVGDCAWYDIDSIGKPFEPIILNDIKKIVFTEPHSDKYREQVIKIILTISNLFPNAEKIYSLHSRENTLTEEYEKYAREHNFIIKKCSHDAKNLDYYKNCDLHIGYRVHGYISFLRLRKPAILFMEDGRGVGQGEILKTGCINAFEDGYEETIADNKLDEKLIEMIGYHSNNNFEDYNYTFNIIDKTYKVAREFIKKSIN